MAFNDLWHSVGGGADRDRLRVSQTQQRPSGPAYVAPPVVPSFKWMVDFYRFQCGSGSAEIVAICQDMGGATVTADCLRRRDMRKVCVWTPLVGPSPLHGSWRAYWSLDQLLAISAVFHMQGEPLSDTLPCTIFAEGTRTALKGFDYKGRQVSLCLVEGMCELVDDDAVITMATWLGSESVDASSSPTHTGASEQTWI